MFKNNDPITTHAFHIHFNDLCNLSACLSKSGAFIHFFCQVLASRFQMQMEAFNRFLFPSYYYFFNIYIFHLNNHSLRPCFYRNIFCSNRCTALSEVGLGAAERPGRSHQEPPGPRAIPDAARLARKPADTKSSAPFKP